MPCYMPPEIDATELLAFVNGDAGDRVAEHLRLCDHCRARAEAIASQEGRLTSLLYRFDCPSSQELGEYQLGMMDATRKASIDEHLGWCLHCSQELEQLDSFLDELEPDIAPAPLQAVRTLVAQLVSRSRQALDRLQPDPLRPAMAGVRGTAQGPLVFEAEDAQISIRITPDEQTPGTYKALGLIIGADLINAKVYLWRGGTQVASAAVDDLGAFELGDLVSGIYQLILSSQAGEVQIPRLEV